MANSARHDMFYDPETVYGVTETTPVFDYIRHTGTTLGTTKTQITSEELYSDRGIRDERHGNKNIAGDIPAELSYGSFDDLIEAALGGTWSVASATITAATISATASGNTIDDSGSGFGSFAVGMMVKISGFAGTLSNNGVARVTVASAASLTLDGLNLTDEVAGNSITIAEMDQLKAGVTRRSFSILRDFTDLTNGRFQLFTGSAFNTLAMTTGLDAIVTTNFGLIGKLQTSSASAPGGSTFNDPNTNEPFVAFDGCLSEGGDQSAIISAFDFTLDNGIEPKFNVCSDTTDEPGIGRTDITGNITAFFDNDTLLNKFLNETKSQITTFLTDSAGNTFSVFFPEVLYNSGQPDIGGEANSPISLSFRALHEATISDTSIIISRLAGV